MISFESEQYDRTALSLFFAPNEHRLEVLTDYAGSRTTWYLVTPELFVAATSQRMILAVARSFEFNPVAVKWLLSSGATGPGISWDKRIRMIGPNSSVILDRHAWTTRCFSGADFPFIPENRPFVQHREELKAAVETSIRDLDFTADQWALALSGGMDSRSLLYFLKDKGELDLITWGTDNALLRPNSDASIAKRLADTCGLWLVPSVFHRAVRAYLF
jgi:asparagine synthetase B (glutamine-hydrolysing)